MSDGDHPTVPIRIIYIHDDVRASAPVLAQLKGIDAVVDPSPSLEEAAHIATLTAYDVALWDLEGARDDDLAGFHRLRDLHPNLAMLLYSGTEHLALLNRAMDAGACDFILKPARASELRLRIDRVALSQAGSHQHIRSRATAAFGPLTFDTDAGQFSLAGEPLNLTPRERAVLQVLIRNQGQVVSKERIAERVFALDEEATAKSIETYAHRLRRKLAQSGIAIRTERGLGYRLERSQPREGQ